MQFDSDPIGIYVFGGVVIAGTAVAVIVDMLRKNNDHLWEIATELKFRNDAADSRIKQLEFANAEAVAYANAQAEAVARAVAPVAPETVPAADVTTPVEVPAASEAKPVELPVVLPLPGARIDLTPSPEKVELKVAAEAAKPAVLEQQAEPESRPERRKRQRDLREMSPAVAAVASLVEARLAGPRIPEQPALRVSEFAANIPLPEPVGSVEAIEVVAVKPDPSDTLKIPVPAVAEEFAAPALADVIAYLEVRLSVRAPQVAEALGMALSVNDLQLGVILPLFELNILPTLEAAPEPVAIEAAPEPVAIEAVMEPVAEAVAAEVLLLAEPVEAVVDVPAVTLEVPAVAELTTDQFEAPLEAPLVAIPVVLHAEAPALPAAEVVEEPVASLEVIAVDPVGSLAEPAVPEAALVPLEFALRAEDSASPAAATNAPVSLEAIGFELMATAPVLSVVPVNTPLEEVAALVEPDPAMAETVALAFNPTAIEVLAPATPLVDEPVTSLDYELTAAAPFFTAPMIPTLVAQEAGSPERRKNWNKILGNTQLPAAETTLTYRPKLSELPAGFHPVSVLRQAADSRLNVTGMVLAIGVEASDPAAAEEVARFVQSLIQGRDFACQTDSDEFLLICPPDQRPSSQRKLGAIAEKLWDFQLSSMGTLDVQFCWGGFEARGVSIAEAVNSALDQMRETRNERRMAQDTRAAVS